MRFGERNEGLIVFLARRFREQSSFVKVMMGRGRDVRGDYRKDGPITRARCR